MFRSLQLFAQSVVYQDVVLNLGVAIQHFVVSGLTAGVRIQ
jgi:hypothetical protein